MTSGNRVTDNGPSVMSAKTTLSRRGVVLERAQKVGTEGQEPEDTSTRPGSRMSQHGQNCIDSWDILSWSSSSA